jgi:hypothetical protein
MALRIVEIHPASPATELNQEWFVLENPGDKPFHTKNCTVGVSRPGQKKRRDLGTLDPGFALAPNDKVRVITGNPGKKAHGKAPEDKVQNYHLFLAEPILMGAGTTVAMTLRSMVLASAEFAPKSKSGIASTKD